MRPRPRGADRVNLDESRIWLRSILPDDPQFTVRQVGPSFPDFHVAEVQLAGETVASEMCIRDSWSPPPRR